MDVKFTSNYWELYPSGGRFFIKSVERVGGVGLKILFSYPVDCRVYYRFDGGEFRELLKPFIVLRFCEEVKRSRVKLEFKVVSNTSVEFYNLVVGYYSKKLYEESGQTAPGYIILHESTIDFYTSRVEDWVEKPSPEDLKEIHRIWGWVLEKGGDDFERAKLLAKDIIRKLEPHRGIPSDLMEKSPPLEQYKIALKGLGKVWCSNIAAIYAYACNGLGIPARIIEMGNIYLKDDYWILLAEGHATVEVFLRDLKQWAWIDPTFRLLGAYLENIGPLNLIEVYYNVNNPNRLKHLWVELYDPKSDVVEFKPLVESKVLGSLKNYFKKVQEFKYKRFSRT